MKKHIQYIAALMLVVICCSCKKDNNAGELADNSTPADSALVDKGWPRIIEKEGAKLVYYQPQLGEWKDFSSITADIAFSITKDKKETLGIMSIAATTLVDKDARQVYFNDLKVNDVRFPALDAKAAAELTPLVKSMVPKSGNPIAIDRLMADLQQKNVNAKPVAVKNDPPQIFYSTTPSILLTVQGDPVLAPIENTNLQYVVNTNWDLFFDKAAKEYYLLVGEVWLKSKALDKGWAPTTALPADMKKLPSDQGFDDVKKEIPAKSGKGPVPSVFFSSKPAELILTEGEPKYKSIAGTGLSYIENTENDVFKDDKTGNNYVLLSGRWFEARNLKGPWGFATNNLPAGFAKIPEDSAMGHVLSSVPGTQQAQDAVMLAQVPTTAIVNKAEVEKKVNVHYDGDPQFKPVESTNLQYATNTQEKVIKDGDLYYLCFQGVWFMSTTANGPWKTASSVPDEIYTIPPSSPVYNVTYVTQIETSPTTVESQTTAGYFGMFVLGMTFGAVLTYGTGYYYPPYMYYGPMMPYPVYRPWPMTYGAGAIYNPWTGGYAAGRRVYGPYGAAGTSAWYNPATGRYGRSASVQGWYGGRTSASTYNPWTGAYGHTNQGHNPYAQWGSSVASKGGDWVRTGHINTRNGGAFAYQTSGGKEGVITRGPNGGTVVRNDNGVFAGHDGNVYKKDNNGNWSKYDKGNWNNVDHHNNIKGETRNNNLSGTTHKDNLSGATRNAGKANVPSRTEPATRNLGGETRHEPDRTMNRDLGTASREMPQERNLGDHDNVMDGLRSNDAARQRGEMQTQRFNNFERNGGGGFHGGGGGFHGGGGFRGRH